MEVKDILCLLLFSRLRLQTVHGVLLPGGGRGSAASSSVSNQGPDERFSVQPDERRSEVRELLLSAMLERLEGVLDDLPEGSVMDDGDVWVGNTEYTANTTSADWTVVSFSEDTGHDIDLTNVTGFVRHESAAPIHQTDHQLVGSASSRNGGGLPATAETSPQSSSCSEAGCGAWASAHAQEKADAVVDAAVEAFVSGGDSAASFTSNYAGVTTGSVRRYGDLPPRPQPPPLPAAKMSESGERRRHSATSRTMSDPRPAPHSPPPSNPNKRGGRGKTNHGNKGGSGRWGTRYMSNAAHATTVTKARLSNAPHHKVLRPSVDNQRFIFGQDDRGRVSSTASRKYPYYNVVRMSNGCTGTLVSPLHVLTAAHCLHTGYQFKTRPATLKVIIPHSMGFKVFYGRTAKVSWKWHKISSLSNLHRAMFDYGILELRTPVFGRRRFTGFDWRSDTWHKRISFLAYPNDNRNYLLRSTCVVDFKAGSLLLNRCDSSRGTSGSAALMTVGRRELRIVGVVSAVISDALPARDFNAITRLTLMKLWDVCDMIGRGWDKYVCSEYQLQKRPTRRKSYLYQTG